MKTVYVTIRLRDGHTTGVRQRISDAEFSRLTPSDVLDADTAFAFFYRAVRELGIESAEVDSYDVDVSSRELEPIRFPDINATATKEPAHGRRGIERCHSILRLAHIVLPTRVRDEALDEWIDEIECAAAEKKPVLRRTLSIVFRSLPSLALRARLPARARREGGS